MANLNKYGEIEDSVCTKCGEQIKPEWKVCPICATHLSREDEKCSQCGLPLKAGWKACPECGTRVSREPSTSNRRRSLHNRNRRHIQTTFIEALESGDYETAQEMLEEGADINCGENSDRPAPLWCACVNADLNRVIWLVEHGADPNVDKPGSPLEAASSGTFKRSIKKRCLNIMKYLIEVGADVNYEENGLSIVDLSGSKKAKRLLMRYGARSAVR